MTTKLFALLTFLVLTLCTFGQDTTKQNLFRTGIYLENLHVTIPWDTDYKKIVSVGNPIIDTPNRYFVRYRWDSVKILNNVPINLSFYVSKHDLKKNKPLQVINFSGIIDTSDIQKIKFYLADYTNKEIGYKNIKTSGGWKINECRIKIGVYKWRRQPPVVMCDIQKYYKTRVPFNKGFKTFRPCWCSSPT